MKSKPQRPGRSDGDQTRVKILETAGKLFAKNGFAKTPSTLVAAEAGVDLASINYHFGNREGLYEATLVESHRGLISLERLQEIEASPDRPEAKIRKLMDTLLDSALGKRGWHAGVFAREMLSPSSHLKVMMSKEVQPKIKIFKSFLSAYTGMSTDDPALLRSLISVAAPCLMLLIASRGVPGPLTQLLKMSRGALVDDLYKFAIGGLDAIARGNAHRANDA